MRVLSQWRRVGQLVLLAGLVTAALARGAPAQTTTGSIRGNVTDTSGTGIEGARVVATSVQTGAQREVTTPASGFYALLGLVPGEYDVTAREIGMAPRTLRVRVLVGEVVTL